MSLLSLVFFTELSKVQTKSMSSSNQILPLECSGFKGYFEVKQAIISILYLRGIFPQNCFILDKSTEAYEWKIKESKYGSTKRFLMEKLKKDLFDAIKHKYCPAILIKVVDKKGNEFEKWTIKINEKLEIIMEGKAILYKTMINGNKIKKSIIRKRIGWNLYSNSNITNSVQSISKSLPALYIDYKDIHFCFTILYDDDKTPKNYLPPTFRV